MNKFLKENTRNAHTITQYFLHKLSCTKIIHKYGKIKKKTPKKINKK